MPLKFTVPIQVRFRDLDTLGHINNAVYLSYFEIARAAYWKEVVGATDLTTFPFLVARAECNFRAAATLGDALSISTGVTRLGNTSLVMEYRVFKADTGQDVVDGLTVLVCYDHAARTKIPIPAPLRQRIQAFEELEAPAASSPV
jgi:acyl-CoA thioester hydrolase